MKRIKEEIEQIQKESNNKIYYLIFDEHKKINDEILANYNMGIITFIEKLTQAIDNHSHMLGIFLDFSKAFDTLDHKILL